MKRFGFTILFSALLVLEISAQAAPLVPGERIGRQIATGERHSFSLSLEAGQFVRLSVAPDSLDLVVDIIDPSGTQLDELDSGGPGDPEELTLASDRMGDYHLEVFVFEKEGEDESATAEGAYSIDFIEYLTVSEYRSKLDREEATRQSTIQWIRETAIPLKGVEAETGFDDMQPLKAIVGDARIVALGEATHGTREFFQLKHRMLEFLVTEMGFNIFGIEATMPEGFDVNDYVLYGKGDPEKALAALYFWTWNTEEVLEMIRWMRRYNADPGHTTKVKFYGFDMQVGVRAFEVVTDYLESVGSNDATLLREEPTLSLLADPYTQQHYMAQGDYSVAREVLEAVTTRMDDNEPSHISMADAKNWQVVRHHAEVLKQYLAGGTKRDSSMAANVRWIMDHEGPDAKMVYWAHNGHVATSGSGYDMGAALRQAYGNGMVVFGFSFNQGSFQAGKLPNATVDGLQPFQVAPLENESLDATLAEAGIPYLALDLRNILEGSDPAKWFAEPRATRYIGAAFSPGLQWGMPAILPEWYDALLFVSETTAARPNPGGTRAAQPMRSRPENLGFEFDEAGVDPTAWKTQRYLHSDFGYEIQTVSSGAFEGTNSLMIRRNPGKHYGETYAMASQRLDAAAYMGKTVRISGAVRADVTLGSGAAYLWAKTSKRGIGPASMVCSETMSDRPITGSDWATYSVECPVGPDVITVEFGPAFSGVGSAWFDAFSVSVVEER